jgi:TrmH family RNA methyltransferase
MTEINSVNNPHIKALTALLSKKERQEKGKFLVEGYHLCEEAARRGLLDEILICDLHDEVKGITNYFVNYDIIKKITKAITPQPIVGVVNIRNNFRYDFKRYLLLDDVSDPGNMGTIIRSAVAFGVEALIMSPDTVDIYNDKVIRATQGTLFELPYIYEDLKEAIVKLKNRNIRIFGTALKKSISIHDLDIPEEWAIIMGNEARGISDHILGMTDYNIIIPILPVIDSLNVSVSAGIVLYEFTKKTRS